MKKLVRYGSKFVFLSLLGYSFLNQDGKIYDLTHGMYVLFSLLYLLVFFGSLLILAKGSEKQKQDIAESVNKYKLVDMIIDGVSLVFIAAMGWYFILACSILMLIAVIAFKD